MRTSREVSHGQPVYLVIVCVCSRIGVHGCISCFTLIFAEEHNYISCTLSVCSIFPMVLLMYALFFDTHYCTYFCYLLLTCATYAFRLACSSRRAVTVKNETKMATVSLPGWYGRSVAQLWLKLDTGHGRSTGS